MTAPELAFHHIGVVSTNLDRDMVAFACQGYTRAGEDFEDPVQGIQGRFLEGPGPRLELVRQTSEEGVLANWSKQGTKFYHLAYETPNIDATLEAVKAQGGKIVVAPVPAVAFDNLPIAFVMMRNMALVEYIQAKTA